jgi:2,4-dienoyl-CoA reductase-like NADH-dependent reductase (Old Yellow Enzyme family)
MGAPTDWHVAHLGARAAGGAGLILTGFRVVELLGGTAT